jgi:two-component system sensor histidine kinase HydH
MRHGAYLGIGMTALSVLMVALLILPMFEREVIGPLQRVGSLLPKVGGPNRTDDLRGIEDSVVQLLEREQAVEELAADRDRMLRAQDGLARVGGLAAEMAHEFKRPLASIRTAVNVLEQEYVIEDGGQQVLDAVNVQLERLSETMEDLFALAKPVELGADVIDIADTLDDALLQLSGLPGAEAVTVKRLYDTSPPIVGDQHRLTQAFSNILTNAVEAMPKGGYLTVSVYAIDARRIQVSVRDTGVGLTADEAERALRPFYSTKPFGTGLGLSVVARIVAAHGGNLAIRGGPDGTVVTVCLPVLETDGCEGEL